MPINHQTQSSVPDDGVAGEIGPSEWNEPHTLPAVDELSTTETNTALRLVPDGVGGVEWGAAAGVSFDPPTDSAFGDVNAEGVDTDVARADHKHGREANPVTAHEAAGDPHAGYVQEAATPGGELGGTYATPTVDATHSGSSHAAAQAAAEATAASALSTHAGQADPHTGYRLESADHSHASTGAQAGQLDHGAALTGLTDDDHTQYLKEKLAGGTAAEVPEHDHSAAGEGGLVAGADPRLLSDIETYERLIITAHRGDMNATDGYPEGTLEGARLAAEKGVNRVDLDVRRSADGTWHIMHDATVDRTTGGTGTIVGKTDAQIAALQIDGGYGYVAGRHASPAIRVPTLASVLVALSIYDITYQLDVKVDADADEIAQFCVTNGIVHRVALTLYSDVAADAALAVDPRFHITRVGYGSTGAEWDSGYTLANVQAAAPDQYFVLVPIEDFGVADESQIVQDAFARGARGVIANDIDAALAGKALALGGASGGASVPGPSYIPFGSEAADGEAFDNSAGGAEAFAQFGFVTRLVDPTAYPYDPLRVVLEAHAKTADVLENAKVRLWDITDGVAVSGSTIVSDSLTPERIRSAGLTLDEAEHEYRIEVGAVAGGVATVYDAVLLIGSNSNLSEGADGESAPPPAASGLMEDVVNEIKHFPSQYPAVDDAQPAWWDEADANATLTEVDLAGEAGITEKYERAHKLVVATAPSYYRQLYTYADEPRLKAGKTYSVACDCWAVAGAEQRLRVQSSVGSLGVASNDLAAWTVIEVEGVALNGTTVELRFEGDIGTFYFVPLGLVEGSEAPTTPLRSRGGFYQTSATPDTAVEDLNSSSGKAVADVDLTAASHPLAFMGDFRAVVAEEAADTSSYRYYVRPNGTSWAVNSQNSPALVGSARGDVKEGQTNHFTMYLDPNQIIETCLEGVATTSSCDVCRLYMLGFWRWE